LLSSSFSFIMLMPGPTVTQRSPPRPTPTVDSANSVTSMFSRYCSATEIGANWNFSRAHLIPLGGDDVDPTLLDTLEAVPQL
jgi:hypothetical protein